jgi:SAM-dependent methyltransferase
MSEGTNILPKFANVSFLKGDGNNLPFPNDHFDTVLNIQVLEHSFTPIQIFNEGARVLKPDGRYILLIPQNAAIHMAPHHYQNFTRYWILEAASRENLEVISIAALGGWWRSLASRQYSFFLTALKIRGHYDNELYRGPLFYMLVPMMFVVALFCLPLFLFLSLGDLLEEPPNNLVVLKKRSDRI